MLKLPNEPLFLSREDVPPHLIRGASWVRRTFSLCLLTIVGFILFYAAILAFDWSVIRRNWVEVPATYRLSEASFPPNYKRFSSTSRNDYQYHFSTNVYYTYNGSLYVTPEVLSGSLASPQFGDLETRMVNVKFLPDKPKEITINPKTDIFIALEWSVVIIFLAWLVYVHGGIVTRALRIPEDV